MLEIFNSCIIIKTHYFFDTNVLLLFPFVCAVFKKDFGPGPSHALDPAITYRGHEGNPHYSLSSRHKELLPFNTPGPGSYAPEKSKTCYQGEKNTPAYSMGSRTRFRKRKNFRGGNEVLNVVRTQGYFTSRNHYRLIYVGTLCLSFCNVSPCRRCGSLPQQLLPPHPHGSPHPQPSLVSLLHALRPSPIGRLRHGLRQHARARQVRQDHSRGLPEEVSCLLHPGQKLHAWRWVLTL